MELIKFYNIINAELQETIERNAGILEIKRHKDKHEGGRKGYASLIWFLDFYGQKTIFRRYITDGKGDNSCDIIFSNKDSQGETFFYIIQSKWAGIKKEKGTIPQIKKEEFGQTLTDFSSMLQGTKRKGENENYNQKYSELEQHLEANGKVKFIYFTLAAFNGEIEDDIKGFNKNYQPNIELEVISLEKIRRDYIEFVYKEIKTNNPLEYKYDAEENIIEIDIERSSDKRDVFKFQGRTNSYLFLISPKTVFELFEKYKFGLFYKNVRNPLHESNYNKDIVKTLNTKPDAFWYFNNGITAITELMPEIGVHAKKVAVHGLQIINGAQTIYSVYQAYLNASAKGRKTMNADARIMLRLIRSSDAELNDEITKFTNSQNPLLDRDFFANDEVQIRLQNESFKTNYWYEKRRGEFRLNKKREETGITIIPNDEMAIAYLAFHKQHPVNAMVRQKNFFISRKENSKGLYEEIFNIETKYEDMLASFLLWKFILENLQQVDKSDFFSIKSDTYTLLPFFSLSKIVLSKYLKMKYKSTKPINLSLFIIDNLSKKTEKNIDFLLKPFLYSIKVIRNKITLKTKKHEAFITDISLYEKIRAEIEDIPLTIEIIENVEME